MKSITRSERNIANRIIEEFMLSANESVAGYLENKRVASIYRVHEKPDPKRVYEFEIIASTFGYSLGVGPLPIQRIQPKTDRRANYGTGKRARGNRNPQRSAHHTAYVSEAHGEDCRQAGRENSFLPDVAFTEAGAIFGRKSGALCAGGPDLYPFHVAHPPLSRSHHSQNFERCSARLSGNARWRNSDRSFGKTAFQGRKRHSRDGEQQTIALVEASRSCYSPAIAQTTPWAHSDRRTSRYCGRIQPIRAPRGRGGKRTDGMEESQIHGRPRRRRLRWSDHQRDQVRILCGADRSFRRRAGAASH